MNPFNRKKFIASAEAYLEGCRQEAEAKIFLANLATRNLKNLAAELERLEDSNPPALKGPDPEPPHSDAPLPVGEPPPLSGEVPPPTHHEH